MPTTTTTKSAKKSAPAIRNLANPQRTTLAHLDKRTGTPKPAALPEYAQELPTATANVRRTILMVAPEIQQLPEAVPAA
ncbi:hypothetical protein OG897_21345 [Streptomyces sp. NBC_00237]|uniref:hypothetical protein n=1 Tax=Streptomyces sp. NBC_00237 TaxID=2975687 RepID=UPI00224EB335|nr:hypothetical protein [Streptomyces sp. NBC_00237]MCX5203984.1 hypothetical protein [Streptomyces sp. NBC_00237]